MLHLSRILLLSETLQCFSVLMGDENDFRPVTRSRRRATITSAKGELVKRPNGANSADTNSRTWTKPKHKGQDTRARVLPEEKPKDSHNDNLR